MKSTQSDSYQKLEKQKITIDFKVDFTDQTTHQSSSNLPPS